MKHKLSITILLLGMFLATQFIGLFVVNYYSNTELPYGLQAPENDAAPNFISIIFSFILAMVVISLLMKYKWKSVIKIWFLFVVCLALAISVNAIFGTIGITGAFVYAIIFAAPLAILKIFKSNFYVHNLTELLIYPGIACVFIPILTPISAVILLVLISVYDMWAVWKSGLMQKMANFQMNEMKIFGGFLIPSATDKVKMSVEKVKQKYKGKKIPDSVKNKKYKVNLAILGGGDVIWPIITGGVFLRSYGWISAIMVMFGALAGLIFLFATTKKGKSYPAMPYISVGIFLSLAIWKLFF